MRTTGGYFYHLEPRHPNPQASDIAFQDRLLTICEEISGVDMAECRLDFETMHSARPGLNLRQLNVSL